MIIRQVGNYGTQMWASFVTYHVLDPEDRPIQRLRRLVPQTCLQFGYTLGVSDTKKGVILPSKRFSSFCETLGIERVKCPTSCAPPTIALLSLPTKVKNTHRKLVLPSPKNGCKYPKVTQNRSYCYQYVRAKEVKSDFPNLLCGYLLWII